MSSDSAEESEDEYSDNVHSNLTRRPIHGNRDEPPDAGGEAPSKPKGGSSLKTCKISIGTKAQYTIQSTELYPKIIKSDEQESSTSSPKKKETEKPSKGGKVDDETSRAPRRGIIFQTVCAIVVGVLAHQLCSFSCSIIGFYFFRSSTTIPHFPLLEVDAVVTRLKKDYSTLDEKNFRVLNASLHSLSKDAEPEAPAVLLLAFPEADGSAPGEFPTDLVKTLSSSYILLAGKELSGMKDAKRFIDDTIRESIEARRTNVFLVTQLELINFETMLIFHSFCDDQNAPYKRAVFVLTVSCSYGGTSSKWDEVGMQCLKQHWPDTEEDNIGALIARLTQSVMILKKS